MHIITMPDYNNIMHIMHSQKRDQIAICPDDRKASIVGSNLTT